MKRMFSAPAFASTEAAEAGSAAAPALSPHVALTREPPRPRRRWVQWLSANPQERVLLWCAAIVFIGVVWQVVAVAFVRSPLFFPSFTDTVSHAWQLYVSGHSIYGDFAQSMYEAGVGFGLSLTGIPLGLLIGLSRRLMIAIEPVNSAMYALPHIALVPLAIIWFGLGVTSKAFIVFISAFFLILINVSAAVATIGRELQDVAATYSASRWRTFITIILPGSVPFIFVALQLAIGRALVGVVAAELFASNKGLGYLLGVFGNNFETADLFVAIATFAAVGAILSVLFGLIGRRFEKWRIAA